MGFPTSPSNGDTYTNATTNVTYQYVSADDKWIIIVGSSAVSDTAYAASWDGVTTIAPSKHAVYDMQVAHANGTLTHVQIDAKIGTSATIIEVLNNIAIKWRNAANNAWLECLKLDTSDYFHIAADAAGVYCEQDLIMYAGHSILIQNNAPLNWRNVANSANLECLKLDGSDILQIGAGAASINTNGKLSHTNLTDKGTNTHTQIDTAVAKITATNLLIQNNGNQISIKNQGGDATATYSFQFATKNGAEWGTVDGKVFNTHSLGKLNYGLKEFKLLNLNEPDLERFKAQFPAEIRSVARRTPSAPESIGLSLEGQIRFTQNALMESNAELESRIADLEAKNKILEANMQVILDAIKNGKTNPNGNSPDPSVV